MKHLLLSILSAIQLLSIATAAETAETRKTSIPLLEGEKIWSGTIREATSMPFASPYSFDFYANNENNQIQPLLLSNKGLYVWSEQPYAFQVTDDELIITDSYNSVTTGRSGKTLTTAREYASETFFPPSGKLPDPLLFSRPQYNTWIELTYYQNQKSILQYARAIIDNGFPPAYS